MKKATIYDVAREAGVSLATVSRVINGSSVVREKTKEKVMKVIDELNFKPNQIARGLATNKTTTIAIIFPQSLFAHVKDMIGGIGDAGRTLDYNITIYTTDDIGNGPMDDVMEKVIRIRADGVILFNNDNIDQQIELVKKHSIPAVVIGMQVSDESIGSVYVDAQKITYDIVNNYLEKGKNDIIFVSPQQNLIRTVDLIEGMKKAYQDHQLPFDESTQVINTSTHYEESYTQFVEHFRNHKHDLVFASYDKEGVAVVNAAIDNNISIPDDMEVMAMMDTSYSLICRPSLSTIHLPIYDMGALAVRLLTKILNQEELETKEVCVGYTNIYRKSTIQ